MLTNEEKEKLKEQLLKKTSSLVCPMCHNKTFTMADGYFSTPLQKSISFFSIGGRVIPAVAIICDNCGFISQHAVGRLGLLGDNQEIKSDEPK